VTTQRVELERVVLAVRRWTCPEPSRPTVLLLHGTGATAQDWDTVAAPLSQDREVLAVDLRGHGLSDWPGDYSLQLFTEDVVGLLERLDPAPVDLTGDSSSRTSGYRIREPPRPRLGRTAISRSTGGWWSRCGRRSTPRPRAGPTSP
jgi:hypothetical protein